jgi:hypothetical protein
MYLLKSLLELAKQINANMTWVAIMNKPSSILVEAAWLDNNKQIDVSTILCQQRDFFSAHYFNEMRRIIKSNTTCRCIVNTLENFFDFILL